MEFHRGRLFDHVQLRVADLGRSLNFYRAVLEAIGHADALTEGPDFFWADELYVDKADGPVSRVHIAFQAEDEAMVRRFHELALAAGGADHGAPGPRDYHPGYYAAFVRDPDGNNVEAVYHGPSTRSAESVVFKPL